MYEAARSVRFIASVIVVLAALGAGTVAAASLGAIPGQLATIGPPVAVVPQALSALIGPNAARLAQSEAHMARSDSAWARRTLPISLNPVVPPSAGPVRVPDATTPQPAAPGSVSLLRGSVLAPTTGSSNINEPAVSQSGRYIFYTGNWYAARSTNDGSSWSYIDPYADFASFCCDQDTIYEQRRDLFLWYRQGTGVPNAFKLGTSTNNGFSFCMYTTTPTDVDPTWTNQWWDYPHLSVSDNYLYITTNVFNAANAFVRMVLLRWPLEALQTCSAFTYSYWTSTSGWAWTPVQGATTTMYLGDHISTSVFRVYRQPEDEATLYWVDRDIPAWTTTVRDGTCTVLGGSNPCARADHRITAGWVRAGAIGFFWNVREGGGFPYPYVNAATFFENSQAYKDRPYIWSSTNAYQWASASPNERGDLGISVYYFGACCYPRAYAGIDDAFNGAPPGWEIFLLTSSYGAPSANTWGDYSRIRPHYGGGMAWVAAVYRKIGGSVSQPQYWVFARVRDARSYWRWRLY